jgi:hypothetical protein
VPFPCTTRRLHLHCPLWNHLRWSDLDSAPPACAHLTRTMCSEFRRFQDFPIELLSQCFRYLRNTRYAGWLSPKSKLDLQNVRLVCQSFNAAGAPLLLCSVRVDVTSDSIRHLEELSRHPIFKKSIRQIEVNVSYYDACLANDLTLFAKHNATQLFQTIEGMERCHSYLNQEANFDDRYKLLEEWESINNADANTFTPGQLLLSNTHKSYCQLFDDQEDVKRDGGHTKRICSALENLLALDSVIINDEPHWRSSTDRGKMLSIKYLVASCLSPSSWKGPFTTAYLASPPVEIIPQLFSSLTRSTVRPSRFSISITPPINLRCMELSPQQQDDVRIVLQHSRHLRLKVSGWARKGSLAKTNDQRREEMLALCSLSKTFFDTPKLATLNLSFDNYPVFYEPPQVGISDILPLAYEKQWQSLTSLLLYHVPCKYL